MANLNITPYGRRPDPRPAYKDGRRVRLYYYGRWYSGHIDRVVGKGAWIVWRLHGRWAEVNHDGKVWRRRWISPERHGAHWRPTEAGKVLDSMGVEYKTIGTLVDELRDGRVLALTDPGFEVQATANALDRLAGRYVVDRGTCDIPRVPLW